MPHANQFDVSVILLFKTVIIDLKVQKEPDLITEFKIQGNRYLSLTLLTKIKCDIIRRTLNCLFLSFMYIRHDY